jgi:hypothetical protein
MLLTQPVCAAAAAVLAALQIQKLLLTVRTHSDGYLYMLGSLFVAVLLGLLIYGIPVWVLF